MRALSEENTTYNSKTHLHKSYVYSIAQFTLLVLINRSDEETVGG